MKMRLPIRSDSFSNTALPYLLAGFLGVFLFPQTLLSASNGPLPHGNLHLLTPSNQLSSASTRNVSSASAPVAITGISIGEKLVAIDVRPQNQKLYALGVNATTDTATLYLISPETAFAGVVGGVSGVKFTTDGSTAVQFPDPASLQWDIDFDPTADRLRVVAGALNFRIDPNSGNPVDGDNGGNAVDGTNPDSPVGGSSTDASSIAYSNSTPDSTFSTLFAVQRGSSPSAVFRSLPPWGLTSASLDISPSVKTSAPGSQTLLGMAWMHARVNGIDKLYHVDLNLNHENSFEVGTFNVPVLSIAVCSEINAAVALSTDGSSLVSFNPYTPTITTAVPLVLTSMAAGEVLIGIDGRPKTGQLYGLGVDAVADTATLYLIDPRFGTLTPVGSPSGISFVTDGRGTAQDSLPGTVLAPLDFPDPTAAGYSFDFSPFADIIRVIARGENFRVSPISGKGINGNYGRNVINIANIAGGIVPPSNPDNRINEGATKADASAYTNNYGQSVTGGITTLYSIDSNSDTLFIHNSPNTGILTAGRTLTLGGAPLDLDTANGFDIPPHVRALSSNSAASGEGWLLGSVRGVTRMYRVNLLTAEVTEVGRLGNGHTSFRGLAVWSALPLPPSISAIEPISGRDKGGYSATITGSDFLGVTKVTLGGVEANITASSATSLTITVPPGAAGLADLTVTTAGGAVVAEGLFTYVEPTSWVRFYEYADTVYLHFAGRGEHRTALAYWFYFRAFADREFRLNQGDSALAAKEFYQGLAYFYYTILEGSYGRLFYYYVFMGTAESSFREASGDTAGAKVYFDFYYNLAVASLAYDSASPAWTGGAGVFKHGTGGTVIINGSMYFNHSELDPALFFSGAPVLRSNP